MNIFNKVALQGLIKNRAQTLVTVIGVALSAAMITAVATFGISLQDYMVRGAVQKSGDWHVGFYAVNSDFLARQAENDRVDSVAAYEDIGYAMLEGGQNPDKPYLFLAGFDEDAFEMLPLTVLSGRLPQNDHEVIVPSHVEANGGVKFAVGDTLTLSVGQRIDAGAALDQHHAYRAGEEYLLTMLTKTYTVVGTYLRPSFEERSAPGYTLVTKTDKASARGTFSAFVKLKYPLELRSYTLKNAGSHAYLYNDNVLRFMGLSSDKTLTALLLAIVGVLVVLIMVGSVFLIYNAFTISLNDRMRQFGILLSVGATQKQLRKSVMFEGLCIGALGIPLGILIGLPSIGVLLSLVSKNFNNVLYDGVPLTAVVSVPVLIAAVAVSLITILISAYIPAKKAASTPVMACIRQTNEIKIDARDLKTSKSVQRLCGLEGTLALKNFGRNRRRYRSIVLSLTLSVVLFVSTSAFSTYLTQVGEQAKVVTDMDICFTSKDMEDDELLRLFDRLSAADGVTKSSYQAFCVYPLSVPADALTDFYWAAMGESDGNDTVTLITQFQFLDDETFLGILDGLKLPAQEYTGEGASLLAVAKMQVGDHPINSVNDLDELFNQPSMDFVFPLDTGDSAQAQQTVHATFATFVPPDTPLIDSADDDRYILQFLIPWSLKERFSFALSGALAYTKGIGFQSDTPSQSTTQMQTMLAGANVTVDYSLDNLKSLLEGMNNIMFVVNLFSLVFVVMISLIATANVFNTISTNIRLRRRELAMLRSVGMADRDFDRMMRFECLLYGLRTLLWGMPLSAVLSLGIYEAMVYSRFEGIHFVLPWASMGISLLGVFVVIFVTMLYAVGRIRRENIIDALRDEMT